VRGRGYREVPQGSAAGQHGVSRLLLFESFTGWMINMLPRAIAVLATIVATATGLRAQEQSTRIAGRDVVVWLPAVSARGARPLLIFSHGFGGCAGQSRFLTAALAQHGYFVVAPNHQDARCGGANRGGASRRPDEPFRSPDAWTDKTYDDRRDDVRAIVKALADSAPLRGRIDLSRIALAGHSLGGYTVMGLAGAWPSWTMPGVRAVLALSPFADPYLTHQTLGGIKVPIMYQSGTRDFGINPSLKRASGVFDETPAPKFYIDFQGAGHMAWTNLNREYQEEILAYSIAFLDRYVLGIGPAPALTIKLKQVADMRWESELGKGDRR